MPETTTETPTTAELDRKVARQWFQGNLAERLMQATSMERNREVLRRGARKMQDGQLGTPGGDVEGKPVNITRGDQIFTQTTPAAQPTAPQASASGTPFWQKALASAAFAAGGAGLGAGVPWLLGAFERPATEQTSPALTDTNTQYRLSITPEAAE